MACYFLRTARSEALASHAGFAQRKHQGLQVLPSLHNGSESSQDPRDAWNETLASYAAVGTRRSRSASVSLVRHVVEASQTHTSMEMLSSSFGRFLTSTSFELHMNLPISSGRLPTLPPLRHPHLHLPPRDLHEQTLLQHLQAEPSRSINSQAGALQRNILFSSVCPCLSRR